MIHNSYKLLSYCKERPNGSLHTFLCTGWSSGTLSRAAIVFRNSHLQPRHCNVPPLQNCDTDPPTASPSFYVGVTLPPCLPFNSPPTSIATSISNILELPPLYLSKPIDVGPHTKGSKMAASTQPKQRNQRSSTY
jgi:hypothetical protein